MTARRIRIVTDCDPDWFVVADQELLRRMNFDAIRELAMDGIVSLQGKSQEATS